MSVVQSAEKDKTQSLHEVTDSVTQCFMLENSVFGRVATGVFGRMCAATACRQNQTEVYFLPITFRKSGTE